jgi:hypothetical protein
MNAISMPDYLEKIAILFLFPNPSGRARAVK